MMHSWQETCLAFGVFVLVLLCSTQASAHLMPAGRGTINVIGDKAYVVMSLPVVTFDEVPACKDGQLDAAQLKANKSAIEDAVGAHLRVQTGGQDARFEQILLNLPGGFGHHSSDEPEIIVMVVARFPSAPQAIGLSLERWAQGAEPIKVQATITEGGKTVRSEIGILSEHTTSYEFFASKAQTLERWVGRGAMHLGGGVDHLAFLLLFLFASARRRRWRVLVPAFVLSYSGAMAFSTLSGPVPPAVVVEALIVLSVAVVAVLHFWKPQLLRSTELALIPFFGLFHGLGFAEVLHGDTHLPIVKLVGFNLGAGLVVAVAAALVAGLIKATRNPAPTLAAA